MHFREYPLLNTPHMVLVLLKEAARADTSVADCANRLWAILKSAGENPPVAPDEVRRRLEVLCRHLTEARLLSPVDGNRFAITARGREALAAHPSGLDTADLMVFPEFDQFIRSRAVGRLRSDPRSPEFDEGFNAYAAGRTPVDNPYAEDRVEHLAWENGWFEALDEDQPQPGKKQRR